MKHSTFIILLVLTLSACSGGQVALAPEEALQTAALIAGTIIAETQAAIPTTTNTPIPTNTATPLPTDTSIPSPTWTFTPRIEPSPTTEPTVDVSNLLINYYLRTDDGGTVGCGDTPIPVYIGIYRTDDPVVDVTNALTTLFSNHQNPYFGLANPLASSSLRVENVTLDGERGWVNVETSGNLVRGNERCVWDQMWVQIMYSARQAARGYTVNVRYNGGPIKDFLSGG
jgi:hypothetical protein